jgi:hypothetical protein
MDIDVNRMTELEKLQFKAWVIKLVVDADVWSRVTSWNTRDEPHLNSVRDTAQRTILMLKSMGVEVPYPFTCLHRVYSSDAEWEQYRDERERRLDTALRS